MVPNNTLNKSFAWLQKFASNLRTPIAWTARVLVCDFVCILAEITRRQEIRFFSCKVLLRTLKRNDVSVIMNTRYLTLAAKVLLRVISEE